MPPKKQQTRTDTHKIFVESCNALRKLLPNKNLSIFLNSSNKREKITSFLESTNRTSPIGIEEQIDLIEKENQIKDKIEKMKESGINYNYDFCKKLSELKKESVFEYAITGMASILKDSSEYEGYKKKDKDIVSEFLLIGSIPKYVSRMLIKGCYVEHGKLGVGFYFSDMLDYSYCYSARSKEIPKVGEKFCAIAGEVSFRKDKAVKVVDNSHIGYIKEETYKDKILDKKYADIIAKRGGINYGISGHNFTRIIRDSEISLYENKFVGRDYLISFDEQINLLYGITFQREEYCIIWKDPNSKKIEDARENIENLVRYNLYYEKDRESALKLISRKKYNKIILISNIGDEQEGKAFIQRARSILGFDVFVLLFSTNKDHLKWVIDIPNVLFCHEHKYCVEYCSGFNEKGLNNLKSKLETAYKCKFKDIKGAFDYPLFKKEGEFDSIDCQGFEIYKHKFLP